MSVGATGNLMLSSYVSCLAFTDSRHVASAEQYFYKLPLMCFPTMTLSVGSHSHGGQGWQGSVILALTWYSLSRIFFSPLKLLIVHRHSDPCWNPWMNLWLHLCVYMCVNVNALWGHISLFLVSWAAIQCCRMACTFALDLQGFDLDIS